MGLARESKESEALVARWCFGAWVYSRLVLVNIERGRERYSGGRVPLFSLCYFNFLLAGVIYP